jgi:hypothetical protein
VYGWDPDPYYNMTEVRENEEMPQQLKDLIGKNSQKMVVIICLMALFLLYVPQLLNPKFNGTITLDEIGNQI